MNALPGSKFFHQLSQVEWATHKFNQKHILFMAARRDLVVRYFRTQWVFIDPKLNTAWTDSLDDERAIVWLNDVPFPRKPGTLEKQKNA